MSERIDRAKAFVDNYRSLHSNRRRREEALALDFAAAECKSEVKAERERIAARLQIAFEGIVNGQHPMTLQHCALLTEIINEIRGENDDR